MVDDFRARQDQASGSAQTDEDYEELFRLALVHEAIVPHFQPILDAVAGAVFAYEIVSRSLPPLEMPNVFFPIARDLGLDRELEALCLRNALLRLKSLPDEQRRNYKFFLNISSNLLADENLLQLLSLESIRDHGLDESQVVLEMTEKDIVEDYEEFEEMVRRHLSNGYSVALDDYGWGHGTFQRLISCRPQYVKLDREFIRDIHLDHYRQHLLKSILFFTGNTHSHVVAEGVEHWQELETLLRLGVRFVQGYLFCCPEEQLLTPSIETMSSTRDRVRRIHYKPRTSDEAISSLVVSSPAVERGQTSCMELEQLFNRNPHLDHVVLVHGIRPLGLITRQHFFEETSGYHGTGLFLDDPVDSLHRPGQLIVAEQTSITVLAKLAMDRPEESLYDPVVVTDSEGDYVGTITMKQLITRSGDLQVQRALDRNPLTNLPGNRAINHWIAEAIISDYFFVVYADLDRFKEYNDVYGFVYGDKMIRLMARVLSHFVHKASEDNQIGHIGGDDMVLVATEPLSGELLQEMCESFDERKRELFAEDHLEKGYYETMDRKGNKTEVPLVTMSLAVVHGKKQEEPIHPEALSQEAASLKKKVKEISQKEKRSTYLLDRRAFPSD